MRFPFLPLVLFCIILSACSKSAPYHDVEIPHYQIDLEIDPSLKEIKANGSLYWPMQSDTLTELHFFLHRDIKISNLTGPQIKSFSIDSLTPSGYAWLPDAVWVNVQLAGPMYPGKPLELFFSYQGCIARLNTYSANAIGTDWVELGLYMPWFLHSKDLPDFTYQVDLVIPENYRVSGLNEVSQQDSHWVLSSSVPVNDMVILASESMKSFSADSEKIQVVFDYVSLSDTLVTRMTKDIQEIADFLMQQFGPVPVKTVHIIQSPRKAGGGYARLGGVVLGDLKEDEYDAYYKGYQRYFAHELAHLWWRHASVATWHDWINEGFAEFSAMMYLRHCFGETYYQKTIDSKRQRMAGTPPLWEFDRHDHSDPDHGRIIENNLYHKGPVLLADLEQKTGTPTFLTFCKKLLSQPTIDTEQLLISLSSVTSDRLADAFRKDLKRK